MRSSDEKLKDSEDSIPKKRNRSRRALEDEFSAVTNQTHNQSEPTLTESNDTLSLDQSLNNTIPDEVIKDIPPLPQHKRNKVATGTEEHVDPADPMLVDDTAVNGDGDVTTGDSAHEKNENNNNLALSQDSLNWVVLPMLLSTPASSFTGGSTTRSSGTFPYPTEPRRYSWNGSAIPMSPTTPAILSPRSSPSRRPLSPGSSHDDSIAANYKKYTKKDKISPVKKSIEFEDATQIQEFKQQRRKNSISSPPSSTSNEGKGRRNSFAGRLVTQKASGISSGILQSASLPDLYSFIDDSSKTPADHSPDGKNNPASPSAPESKPTDSGVYGSNVGLLSDSPTLSPKQWIDLRASIEKKLIPFDEADELRAFCDNQTEFGRPPIPTESLPAAAIKAIEKVEKEDEVLKYITYLQEQGFMQLVHTPVTKQELANMVNQPKDSNVPMLPLPEPKSQAGKEVDGIATLEVALESQIAKQAIRLFVKDGKFKSLSMRQIFEAINPSKNTKPKLPIQVVIQNPLALKEITAAVAVVEILLVKNPNLSKTAKDANKNEQHDDLYLQLRLLPNSVHGHPQLLFSSEYEGRENKDIGGYVHCLLAAAECYFADGELVLVTNKSGNFFEELYQRGINQKLVIDTMLEEFYSPKYKESCYIDGSDCYERDSDGNFKRDEEGKTICILDINMVALARGFPYSKLAPGDAKYHTNHPMKSLIPPPPPYWTGTTEEFREYVATIDKAYETKKVVDDKKLKEGVAHYEREVLQPYIKAAEAAKAELNKKIAEDVANVSQSLKGQNNSNNNNNNNVQLNVAMNVASPKLPEHSSISKERLARQKRSEAFAWRSTMEFTFAPSSSCSALLFSPSMQRPEQQNAVLANAAPVSTTTTTTTTASDSNQATKQTESASRQEWENKKDFRP